MNEKKYDLEERLIDFACTAIQISDGLPRTFAGIHLGNQLVRSGTAPALMYGEAQGAESRNDFIHKMRLALKELRETFNCLRIIKRMKWQTEKAIEPVINENHQLVAIFVKSIGTARNNKNKID